MWPWRLSARSRRAAQPSRARRPCRGPTRWRPSAMRFSSATSISARRSSRRCSPPATRKRTAISTARPAICTPRPTRTASKPCCRARRPSTRIFSTGLLPETALFDSTTPVVTVPGNPQLSAELTALLSVPGSPSYPLPSTPQTPLFAARIRFALPVNNAYRVSYALDAAPNPDGAVPTPKAGVPLAAAAPTQPLRLAFYKNDLRNGAWAPSSPTLLCGGDADPTVFFSVNTRPWRPFGARWCRPASSRCWT